MNRRQELQQEYKETAVQAGIFQIRNLSNGKVFLKSSPNLKTMSGQRFQLESNAHRNKVLQQEWNNFGKDAFVFEILETLSQEELSSLLAKDRLRQLEEKWINQLQPFGERGYHSRTFARRYTGDFRAGCPGSFTRLRPR